MRFTSLVLPALCGLVHSAVLVVEVGEDGLEFNPKSVTAKAGDTVVFKLYAAHNVVQGDIASPCTPSGQGFYSGPYSETNGGKLRFVVNVTNTDPIYYYCSVSRHCQAGMVGGINLPSDGKTLDAYKLAAGNVAGQSVTPSERRGGVLRSEDQQTSPTSASNSVSSLPTSTGKLSPSNSAASATPSPSKAAAGVVKPEDVNGLAALVFGLAAWLL